MVGRRRRRDQRIEILGLESDRFPTATFVLSAPVAVPSTAASGAQFKVSLTGALTLHGTTKTVTIPAQARLTGSEIEVVGSIAFPWGEFDLLLAKA